MTYIDNPPTGIIRSRLNQAVLLLWMFFWGVIIGHAASLYGFWLPSPFSTDLLALGFALLFYFPPLLILASELSQRRRTLSSSALAKTLRLICWAVLLTLAAYVAFMAIYAIAGIR